LAENSIDLILNFHFAMKIELNQIPTVSQANCNKAWHLLTGTKKRQAATIQCFQKGPAYAPGRGPGPSDHLMFD